MTSDQASQLHAYLTQQRWYAGKGRDVTVATIEPLAWLNPPGGSDPAVRVELVTVHYSTANGGGEVAEPSSEVYQVPVSYRREPADHLSHAHIGEWQAPELGGLVHAYDALFDKQATTLWLRGLLDQRAEDGLVFRRVGDLAIDPDEHSLVLGVEQSNTSLVFGEAALLKVYRRVHHGRNPDIEVHEALTHAECDNVARLFGWVEGRWHAPDGRVGTGDLGMFGGFFRTASDGWELALTSVRDLYAEADLHAAEVGGDFAGEARRLGATTAKVHAELARLLPTDTLSPQDRAALVAGMHERLDHAVALVPEVTAAVDGLRRGYHLLAASDEEIPTQRIHGDLHLGQTMRTVAGWRLIDFEGEPERQFAERGGLDCPLRDVAGMLRSFDYAAQALLEDRTQTPQLLYRAAEWAERNQTAFCEGYAEVAGTDPRAHEAVLRAYEIDKAVYEVIYEARNRPGWLPIPLTATTRLAAAWGTVNGR